MLPVAAGGAAELSVTLPTAAISTVKAALIAAACDPAETPLTAALAARGKPLAMTAEPVLDGDGLLPPAAWNAGWPGGDGSGSDILSKKLQFRVVNASGAASVALVCGCK